MIRFRAGTLVGFAFMLLALVPATSAADRRLSLRGQDQMTGTSRASVSSEGAEGNGDSWSAAISDDGRYVAYSSMADNLVSDDSNDVQDVFVRDLQSGSTERISIGSQDQQANGDSLNPAISSDGRFVAFGSLATNLVAGDTNGVADTFLHDRLTGETIRVSLASDGTQADASSFMDAPALSADGRFVAFGSYAANLVPEGDDNGEGNPDVYVHDSQTHETRRVSIASDGTQGNNWSWKPDISTDGRYVTFSSWSDNLVPSDTNHRLDVFVHDRQMGETTRVSVSSSGEEASGDSQYSAISADGRYVTFGSNAANLVPQDSNDMMDIFVHDRYTGATTLASLTSDGDQGNDGSIHSDISGDGRYVLYDSIASNMVPGDSNGRMDLFRFDRLTQTTIRVSVADDGSESNDSSRLPSIDYGGCTMTFDSLASNLTADDKNHRQDVFLRREPCAPPEGVDLDVTYISRAPLYHAYCVELPWETTYLPGVPVLCPGTENDRRWPEPGELVTFTAHILNKGIAASPAFDYAWHVDASEVESGTLPSLGPGDEASATLEWPWGHQLSPDGQKVIGQHTVRFTVDPDNFVVETYEGNNSLEDRTDAMSFSIYITPAMYDVYNTPIDDRFSHSTEDWLQRQIEAMNDNFANSVYPATPQGATLRVRINTIGITPVDPGPDGQHDGGWFIKDDVRHGESDWYDPVADIDWNLVHEVSHQVSIIDTYAIGIVADAMYVKDRGGNALNMSLGWANPGIMGGGDISPHTEHHLYSSHSAAGASTYAGYRNGFYGSYLFDIPEHNYLLVLDNQGNPAAGVQVDLYQRTGPWDWTGHMGLDVAPEITGETDESGIFPLPNRSVDGGTVTANGHTMRDNPFGVIDIIGNQGVFLMRLAEAQHEEFHWLDITQFNLAYWMGDTVNNTLTMHSHVPPAGAPAPPTISAVDVEADRVTVCWLPSTSPSVVDYRVYRATAPRFAYTLAGQIANSLCFEEDFPVSSYEGKIYAVTAIDGEGTESGFSDFAWAPSISHPSSVAITGIGDRIILDPRNGYALARQDAAGRYRHYIGSVHFHLEYSSFLAVNDDYRGFFSHPGDAYDPRHSVRVIKLGGDPLLEFGQFGSGPGEFNTPAGIGLWEQECSPGGPYNADAHTLLLLHFDGDYGGEDGEAGTPLGTTFLPGRFGQGVLIDNDDTLVYPIEGNMTLEAGAVEFWVRLNFDNAQADGMHTLFETEDPDGTGGFQIACSAGNVAAVVWTEQGSGGVQAAAHWQAGQWHHVTLTWQAHELRLLVDGIEVGYSDEVVLPSTLGPAFRVGSTPNLGWQADAVIDELRISNVPRVDACSPLGVILVADSGNHRVKAFDGYGNFISAFGTLGSGSGQFNMPQGLLVDPLGRVVVVDQGNDRIVVLGFDGREFSYLDSYYASFDAPTGIASDPWGRLCVADTGNDRIVTLSADGTQLGEFLAPNDGSAGAFSAPRGIAVAHGGELVVADTGNRRVVTVRGGLPLPDHRTWLPIACSGDSKPVGPTGHR